MATINFKKKSLTGFFLLLFLCFSPGYGRASKGPVDIQANLIGGFDNNVNLNAERQKDGFIQENVALDYRSPYFNGARFRAAYDLLNNNYFEFTDQDYLAQDINAGLDYRLGNKTRVELDYHFDYLYFMNDEDITSLAHKVRVGIFQEINRQSSLRAGYSPQFKDYDSQKARQAGALLSADTRSDNRQQVDVEYKTRLPNKVILKLGAVYFVNDSNDSFHDYYDYDSYKLYAAGFVPVIFDMGALIKFSYQNDDYASRPLADNFQLSQNDDIYQTSFGLSKRLCPNASLIGIYSYRQKNSNEPSQSYSGSIVTLGLYSSF